MKKRRVLRVLAATIALTAAIAGGYFFAYFNPSPLTLGLPFPESIKDKYGIIDAHDNGVHIVLANPADAGNQEKYVTFYAPTGCTVTRVSFEKMINGGGGTPNHVVKIGLKIGVSYEIDLSVETFLPDNATGTLQKQLTFVKVGKRLAMGDKVVTLVSNASGAHICYSVNTPKGKKHPFDFMSDESKLVFMSVFTTP